MKAVWQLVVRLILLAACFLIASVTQVNHLLYTLVKDNYFRYQVMFYASIFSLSLTVAPPWRSVKRQRVLILGPFIGYAAGLLALFLMPLRYGLMRVFSLRDIGADFLLSPALTFQWLVGFYFALLIVIFTTNPASKQELR